MRLLCAILFLFCGKIHSQELMQLIGLDVDNSSFSKYSYSVMYSSLEDEKMENYPYTPYKTLGIYRKGDFIEIKSVDYLIVPSKKGFRYATLDVKEEKNKYDEEREFPQQNQYKIYQSITKPVFFNSKNEIKHFIKELKPTFQDAVIIDYQNISFVCSRFYTTFGFDSKVYGGASWFVADEKMKIYPLDWGKGKITNRVSDYLSNSEKNEIIWNALIKNGYDLWSNEEIEPSYVLYFESSTVGKYKKVFLDFEFLGNGVAIVPFTLLNGNSSRAYLSEGQMIENQKLYNIFQLKKPTEKARITLISPDNSTRTVITKGKISVYDNTYGKPLTTIYIPFNKVLMSEYGVGNSARKWRDEFSK